MIEKLLFIMSCYESETYTDSDFYCYDNEYDKNNENINNDTDFIHDTFNDDDLTFIFIDTMIKSCIDNISQYFSIFRAK